MLRRGLAPIVIAGVLSAVTVSPGVAQQQSLGQDLQTVLSPVLVVSSDILYLESAYGKRVAKEVAQASSDLASENRRIEAELETEEKTLTERRAVLPAEEFRGLADAFDEKVRLVRREQEAKARALVQRQEQAQGQFLSAAVPILEDIMRDSGAAVILERRSVFLSLRAIDITEDALTRINAEIGDGRELEVAE